MRLVITLVLVPWLVLWSAAAPARSIKLATWDLGWFTLRPVGDPALPDRVVPKAADDIARLRGYADALDADIVAFQGVDGPQAAALLFPPDRYVIAITADDVLQRTGFAVRRSLSFTPRPDLTALDPYPDARLHLRSGADVAVALPHRPPLRLLSVHLKSGCRDVPLATPDRPACATLARQATALRDWIAARQAAAEPFLLLGDFARVMDAGDDFFPSLATAAPMLRATAGAASPCWGGQRFVDHILAGDAAASMLQPHSLRVLAYRETQAPWRSRLSEHCPVSVRLDLPD